MHEVIASYAAARLGIRNAGIRRDLQSTLLACSLRDLMYFDPGIEPPPDDVPEDCPCGHTSPRGQRHCACGRRLDRRSRYDIWYYALTTTFFCERQRLRIPARFVDVMRHLTTLRPYPSPRSRHYHDCIFAVTHLIYVLSDYGVSRLSPRRLRCEVTFLRSSIHWALRQRDHETIGEIVDCLVLLGASDCDPLIREARDYLVETQRDDGSWGSEVKGSYGDFHTTWTALDGIRARRWPSTGAKASGDY